MNKGFLTRYHLKISTSHLLIALFVGLGYTILFFLFLTCCREVLGFLSALSEYDTRLILTDNELFFYNFFFAFISCMTGGAKAIEIILQGNVPAYVRNSINTDQSGLLWFFNYWFSKMAILYSLFLPIVNLSDGLDFYRDYWPFFILVLIILFFSQWPKFRLYFRSEAKKWMRILGVTYVSLSLILASISLKYISGLNKVLAKNSVFFNYQIRTPRSEIGRTISINGGYNHINLYLGKPLKPVKDTVILVGYDPAVPLSIKDLKRYLSESQMDNAEQLINLSIDREVKMGQVIPILNSLRHSNARRLFFSTNAKDWGIISYLPPPCIKEETEPPPMSIDCEIYSSVLNKKGFSKIKLFQSKAFFNNYEVSSRVLFDSTVQKNSQT